MSSVLVVEDSEAVGRMLVRVLEHAGHETRLATTGEEALSAAADLTPDVVLLDMRLPDADGLSIAKKLKGSPAGKAIRIIGLSGDPIPEAKRRGLDGFVMKPVAFPELLEAVRG